MLCSICKKNSAVIFFNSVKDNKTEVEGLCYNCAKERGINPLEMFKKQANLSDEEINNMSSQFEHLVEDLSSSLYNDNDENSSSLGSIFANMFGENENDTNN